MMDPNPKTGNPMRVNLPGYCSETLPSGTVRYAVRKEGDTRKKTTIPVGPDDPDFLPHYGAARRHEKYFSDLRPTSIPKSLAWLMDEFEASMETRVASGLLQDHRAAPPSPPVRDRGPEGDRTYLSPHRQGRPFNSSNALDNWFRKRVIEAGLSEDVDGVLKASRSSHGIRKAAGHLLVLEGASQHHIVAVHGHSGAKTSRVCTESVDRQRLASQAMDLLAGMEW